MIIKKGDYLIKCDIFPPIKWHKSKTTPSVVGIFIFIEELHPYTTELLRCMDLFWNYGSINP